MNWTKRVLAALLAGGMLLLLTACGDAGSTGGTLDDGMAEVTGYVVKNEESVSLGTPQTTLDPQTVYASLTYTPEMFYGRHCVYGGDAAMKAYKSDVDYIAYGDEEDPTMIAAVPYMIEAGNNTFNHIIHGIEGYNWMRMSFYTEEDYMFVLRGAYEISGGNLLFTPIDVWEVDDETNNVNYSLGETVFTYAFAFDGVELTLTAGDSSVTLNSNTSYDGSEIYFASDAYLSAGSKTVDGIDKFNLRYSLDGTNYFYVDAKSGENVYNAIGKLHPNGLFTFTVPWEAGEKTYQYVYFYCTDDGLVLTDGTNTYYFNDSYSDRNKNSLSDFTFEEDAEKLEELTDAQLEAVVEKKEDLMGDLADAFEAAGITVSVDRQSGELAMDSSVLFGGDSAVVTDEGKAFLNKFIDVYTSIIFSEDYADFVSKTMVEGHTAPTGTSYEDDMPLSQQRADNVKAYCLLAESGIDAAYIAALSSTMESVGYSNSKPILDDNGDVDMAASRRVSFRFLIDLDAVL